MNATAKIELVCLIVFVLAHYLSVLVSLLRKRSGSGEKCAQGCEGDSVERRAQRANEDADRGDSPLGERLAENRISYFLGLCEIWRQLCGVLALAILSRLAFNQPRIGGMTMIVPVLLTYTSASITQVCPHLINRSTLCANHSWYMGNVMLYAWSSAMQGVTFFMHCSPMVHLLRVAIGFAYPNVLPNILWNTAFAIMTCVVRTLYLETGGVPLSIIISDEIVVTGFLTVVLWKIEELQVSQVRSDLEANSCARAKATMERILSDMCDAVVELSPQLNVTRPCPKLADLLLRHNGATAFKGEEFSSMLNSEDDQERFRDFVTFRRLPVPGEIEQDVENGERVSSIYVNLRDGVGTPVPVQVFHSCHYDPPKDICHIVGLREVEREDVAGRAADNVPLEIPPTAGRAADNVPLEIPPMQTPRFDFQDDDVQSVASGTSSSAASWGAPGDAVPLFAPLIPEHAELPAVSVVLNVGSLEIIGCTLGFKSVTGPILAKSNFRDLLVLPEKFHKWFRDAVNLVLNGQDSPGFDFKMIPPMVQRQRQFEIWAKAFLIEAEIDALPADMGVEHFEDHVDEEEEQRDILCVLELVNVEPSWLVPRKRRQRRRQAESQSATGTCKMEL